ncbi:FAD-binding protein [Sedimentisphaera salicampi]|uniref:Electron transfer flavoprotein large subunit n=1 Tax=Sedimentisphaera salicampi TaxID=1941349 RepID=A0A1W6LQD3_9BACT|nr:FAD-binding protein [Sedimentisphaera salicampi]ARN58005.1 Electron transfer flavoprotein large subunit [Sedimentisphaera salicampi]
MNFILLVKYVPDVSRITDSSFDSETGNLRRASLPGITNPEDISAISLAKRIADRKADGSDKFIALTMGPAPASKALYEALSLAADKAFHLQNSRFAGADTWATAEILTKAIKKIAREEFGDEPYAVAGGMQSCDGDTAQVLPQTAAALNLPIISYAFDGDYRDRRFHFSCIKEGGDVFLSTGEKSFVLTVSSFEYPLYPSFSRSRWARVQPHKRLTAEMIGLEGSGMSNSLTKVVKIFRPKENQRKQEHITSLKEFSELIVQSCKKKHRRESAGRFVDYKPTNSSEVWVVCEPSDKLEECTAELLAEARKLASEIGGVCCLAAFDSPDQKFAEKAARAGADKIYRLPNCGVNENRERQGRMLGELVNSKKPKIVMFSATLFGRVAAPICAYITGSGLTADCTSLHLEKKSDGGFELIQTRPALGGNIMAQIKTINSTTSMATVRPGRFTAAISDQERQCELVDFPAALVKDRDIAVESQSGSKVSDFNCDVIISAGRGLASKENFEETILPFKKVLELSCSCSAAAGASRAAVEHGFADRNLQIGQTGKTVSPSLYIAAGISGAVQHIVGIEKSSVIMSINSDPGCPIFAQSDYYYVGDAVQSLNKIRGFLESML